MSGESLPDDALDLICDHINSQNLVVLAGAGISLAPPSCAPLFRPLRDELLQSIIASLEGKLPDNVVAASSELFDSSKYPRSPNEPVPEVLFENLLVALKSELFTALRILLEGGGPNNQHRFFASLLGQGLPLLITTNFEDNFEQALSELSRKVIVCADGPAIKASLTNIVPTNRSQSCLLWKYHGTLQKGEEETIRITLSQVAKERYVPEKFESLVKVLQNSPLLVIGYSGYDVDISRALIAAAENQGKEIFWLSRFPPKDNEPAKLILERWGKRGHLLIGDMAELIRRIAGRTNSGKEFELPQGSCSEIAESRKIALHKWVRELPFMSRLVALAFLLWKLTKPEAALEVTRLIEEAPPEIGEPAGVTLALMLRFNILREMERYQESESALRGLIELGFHADPEAEVVTRHELGILAVARFDFREAYQQYSQAMKVAQQLRKSGLEAMVSQSLGAALARQGQFDRAETFFRRALELAITDGDRDEEFKANHEIGIINFERNNVKEALRIFRENLNVARDIGNLDFESKTLFELGIIELRGEQNFAEAVKLFQGAYEIAKLLGQERSQIQCLFYLSDVKQEENDQEAAADGFTQCIELAKKVGDLHTLAAAMTRRARSRFLLNNLDGALGDLTDARHIATLSGKTDLLVEIEGLERIARLIPRSPQK